MEPKHEMSDALPVDDDTQAGAHAHPQWVTPHQNDEHLAVARQAAALERAGLYAEASDYWQRAAVLAPSYSLEMWCEARQAFCRHRGMLPPAPPRRDEEGN